MTKKKNLVIKSKSAQPLRVFESADSTPNSKKYIFSGVFTACSTDDHVVVNRNNRVYGEKEVLRHLSYLRENIQTNGFILGELDHPVDRFDTQMKEASHKIMDLWYDQATHCVMGKIEILDTPNGCIARKLVDAGYPLFVSSRAAGEVDPKTKEVHIEQIFTYDIVCTPGFAEARLQRVNESVDTPDTVKHYLNESVSTTQQDETMTKKYGVLLEGVSINEIQTEVPELTEHQKELMENADIASLSKPVNEGEGEGQNEEDEFKLPEATLDPAKVEEEDNADADEEKKDDKEKKDDDKEEKKEEDKEEKKELTDEEKKERRAKIVSVESFDADGENQTQKEKDEKREQIVDVESIPVEDENTEKSDDEDAEKKDEEKKDDDNKEEKTDECGGSDADEKKEDDLDPTAIKTNDAGTDTKAAKKVLNDCDKAEDIKKQTDDDMDKYQQLIKKVKKLSDVKESIVRLYPFSISLSDENFAKFAALKPIDKNKVNDFIVEHAIFDVKTINEKWTTPLNEEKKALKNWLRLAPDEYRDLYVKAPQDVQDAIEESAKYVAINTQADADRFWALTGLKRETDEMLRRSLNEQYVISESTDNEVSESVENARALGYSMDYFKFVEDSI